MKLFNEYITEASSLEDDHLGHLTHAKDIAHEEPKHAQQAHDLIHEFHKFRQGKPSKVGASLKIDGGSSIHIIHDSKGVGVSDKHRYKRGVVARSEEEIDQHFGHQPAYAAALKHVLKNGEHLVNKGHHIQGDLLHSPEEPAKKSGPEHIAVTPNRITYRARTTAPVGIAVHTEYKDGKAHAVSDNALKHTSQVFVPQHKIDSKEHHYSEHDQKATETHLAAAKALLKDHSSEHLTPEHQKHFTVYLNRSTRTDTPPSVEGYKKHLHSEGEKAANKLKTDAGKEKKRKEYESLAKHVDKNAHHFQRSIDIRHHLGQATEHALKGIEHKDMETKIDGKKSPGEGVVIHRAGRPVAKLVPKEVSKALLNNPRFGRG